MPSRLSTQQPDPRVKSRPQSATTTSGAGRSVVVRLEAVRKAYKRGSHVEEVLRGIDLELAPATCCYLLGPSGCGKTTLLSIIGCILRPDRGRVELFGRDVTALDEEQRAKLRRCRLGFIFQRFHLLRGLTALQNVIVPMTLLGVSDRLARRRAEELLERVGLKDYRDHDPRLMSVGQCQRVAIARALANDPDLILADEPTASLDAESGPQVMALLRDLAHEAGKTVLVVTHDARILHFADQIYELKNGQLARQQ